MRTQVPEGEHCIYALGKGRCLPDQWLNAPHTIAELTKQPPMGQKDEKLNKQGFDFKENCVDFHCLHKQHVCVCRGA